MTANRSMYRRMKKQSLREARITEKLEKQQRDARETKEKKKQYDQLQVYHSTTAPKISGTMLPCTTHSFTEARSHDGHRITSTWNVKSRSVWSELPSSVCRP